MSRFVAAVVQMRTGMDPERNAADFEAGVRQAAAKGAAYIQTPEMTGALVRDRKTLMEVLRSEEDDPVFAAARRLAGELGVTIHVGSTPVALPGGKVANRACLVGPDGAPIATYDKIHMFDVDLDNGESWRESATYEPGRRSVVVDTPQARMGLAICYDLRFPHLFRGQALAGAEVLTVPAAFTRQTGEAHWHSLLRARAIENGAWLVAAAQGGRHEDGRETYGHSLIVDPWGRIAAELAHDEPGVAVAEIDGDAVRAARAKIPNLKNMRDFDLEIVEAGQTATGRRAAS
ncbi:carbon-nitrogen hydrolase family protein [Mesorhizobium xinjiangense]|uniref:carbon-nitrogen hydrolase family protein n=1 Tax=Mesorhizobium xinjiangense TaxID=2678685 RepID=UPI0012EDEDBB|nr:carbon-nitrogen hydrolase family protein [Mesorhizobium xinjiangense]